MARECSRAGERAGTRRDPVARGHGHAGKSSRSPGRSAAPCAGGRAGERALARGAAAPGHRGRPGRFPEPGRGRRAARHQPRDAVATAQAVRAASRRSRGVGFDVPRRFRASRDAHRRPREADRENDPVTLLSTQDTVIATLLWLAVAVAYGYWVWRLSRLWRAAPDGRARRRPAEVALLRRRSKTVMGGRDRQTSV